MIGDAAALSRMLGLDEARTISDREERLLGRRFTLRISGDQAVTMRVSRIEKGLVHCVLEQFRPRHQAVTCSAFFDAIDAGALQEVIAPEYRVLGPIDPRD